jgi:hypothetical protein
LPEANRTLKRDVLVAQVDGRGHAARGLCPAIDVRRPLGRNQ